LETTAQLARGVHVGGYFDYLSYRYTEFSPGVDMQLLQDQETVARPRFKYGVDLSYALPFAKSAGNISAKVRWNWQSSTANALLTDAGEVNQPGGRLGSYGLLHLNLDWNEMFGHPIDLSFFASNVLDKTYGLGGSSGYFNPLGLAVVLYGEPRMYGARVRYRFGQ
jgi:iron complex outermembrane receptor protein